jgi:hypothetical protein
MRQLLVDQLKKSWAILQSVAAQVEVDFSVATEDLEATNGIRLISIDRNEQRAMTYAANLDYGGCGIRVAFSRRERSSWPSQMPRLHPIRAEVLLDSKLPRKYSVC